MTRRRNGLLAIGVLAVSPVAYIMQVRPLLDLLAPKAHEQSSTVAHDGEKNRTLSSGPDPHEACDPHNFLVLIKAGAKAKYQRRREIWRKSDCPASYERHNMTYRFMVAMPAHEPINPNGHNQGARASAREILDMQTLKNESLVHRDMEFLSLKDVYDESNFKVLRMLEWAVAWGMTEATSMVVLHDDEYCLRPKVLHEICEKAARANSSLYTGAVFWETAAYEIQKAFDGTFAPYFGGWLEALSPDLARNIVFDPNTLFTSMYLGYTEDLQMGRWVKNQADRKVNPRQIKYVGERSLIWTVEEQKAIEDNEVRRTPRDV